MCAFLINSDHPPSTTTHTIQVHFLILNMMMATNRQKKFPYIHYLINLYCKENTESKNFNNTMTRPVVIKHDHVIKHENSSFPAKILPQQNHNQINYLKTVTSVTNFEEIFFQLYYLEHFFRHRSSFYKHCLLQFLNFNNLIRTFIFYFKINHLLSMINKLNALFHQCLIKKIVSFLQ